MRRFVIETTYHLAVYRQRIYEAVSVEDACQLAIADEGWRKRIRMLIHPEKPS